MILTKKNSSLQEDNDFIIFQTTRSEYDDSEYSVRRRYNDFFWLRQKLEETYPTHLVPVSRYNTY